MSKKTVEKEGCNGNVAKMGTINPEKDMVLVISLIKALIRQFNMFEAFQTSLKYKVR